MLGWLSIAGILWATAIVILRRRAARVKARPGLPTTDDETKRWNADALTAN